MSFIREWTAVRSGAYLTVTGKDAAGAPKKLTGVEAIAPIAGRIIARTVDGERHELAAA